jgi:hypothetical protein
MPIEIPSIEFEPGQPEATDAQPTDPGEAVSRCEGCDRRLGALEALHWSVCLDCTKARARTATTHRCGCGRSARPGSTQRIGSRSWVPCRRCLGTIRQLS